MERYISPFKLPSEYERELLTILIEECAEVQQCATKMLRFGQDDGYPGQTLTNLQHLSRETGELRHMLQLLHDANLIDMQAVADGMRLKREKLKKYMQVQP